MVFPVQAFPDPGMEGTEVTFSGVWLRVFPRGPMKRVWRRETRFPAR